MPEQTPSPEEQAELAYTLLAREADTTTGLLRAVYADTAGSVPLLVEQQAEAATAALRQMAADSSAVAVPPSAAQQSRLQALAATLEAAERDSSLGLNSTQRQVLRKTAQRLRAWSEQDSSAAPEGYLTRSQFARLAQVSANTLVKWDAAGSLVPAYKHPITHYRYYKPEQIAQVKHARQRRQRVR